MQRQSYQEYEQDFKVLKYRKKNEPENEKPIKSQSNANLNKTQDIFSDEDVTWDIMNDLKQRMEKTKTKTFKSWFKATIEEMCEFALLHSRESPEFGRQEGRHMYHQILYNLLGKMKSAWKKKFPGTIFNVITGINFENVKPNLLPSQRKDPNPPQPEGNVFVYLSKKSTDIDRYPVFIVVTTTELNEEADPSWNDLTVLKKHLKDVSADWSWENCYGLLTNIETMTFVKYSAKDDRFYKSEKFAINIEIEYRQKKPSENLKKIYLAILTLIEAAAEEWNNASQKQSLTDLGWA